MPPFASLSLASVGSPHGDALVFGVPLVTQVVDLPLDLQWWNCGGMEQRRGLVYG